MLRTKKQLQQQKYKRRKSAMTSLVVALLLLALPSAAMASTWGNSTPLTKLFQAVINDATPVVNTTISVAKTGSEPFDASTWDSSTSTGAGLDADPDNGVVRLQDSITYKIEVSVNDAGVDNLTTSVQLDKKQAWIELPTGCETDPALATPISSISADGRTLFCNLGQAIEGTARIIYPASRVIGASYDGTEITLNDDHVSATVSAQADNSNVATDGPTDVTVTAGFEVDTTKELQVTATDPDTGEQLYSAPSKVGADGTTKGSVMEYVIKVSYQQGSMLVDAPDEANGDFEIDFKLLDHYTDNNANNNSPLSTGGTLYDWGSVPACELVGNHGPNATVNCSQINHILDQIGPSFTPDGVNDPNIEIDLQNIDVRDPDADTNLVEVKLNIWFSQPADIASGCSGTPCSIMTVNSVGVYDAATSTVIGYNPVSTEDASGTNLPNYNGAGEPHPDYVTYPLVYSLPGSFSPRKSFFGINGAAAATGKPNLTRSYSPGSTIPLLINSFDYRHTDGARAQHCDNLDTTQFEFVGFSAPNRTDTGYAWNDNKAYNPTIVSYGPSQQFYNDGSPFVTYLYSDIAHTTLITTGTALEAQRGAICHDDVNGDGMYVIDGIDQATGAAATPTDWVTDPALLAGGAASVEKIRVETELDLAYNLSVDPAAVRVAFTTNFLLKIKLGATGYASPDGNSYIPNYSNFRLDSGDGNWDAWRNNIDGSYAVSADPNDANFGYEFYLADRVILIPSSKSIEKYTEPRGIKVIKGGDIIDFIIEPKVFGGWAPTMTVATVADTLPAGTEYVTGSEKFSIDNGTTWMTYDQYIASSPAITITTPANDSADLTLNWDFDSVDAGEQLPLIKYTVAVDPTRVNGSFVNTTWLASEIGGDDDGDGIADTKSAKYQLDILPQSGINVQKLVDYPIYQVNEPFTFELNYKNLGGENYTNAEYIDILPYVNDGTGLNTSGLDSTRNPNSNFSGTYALTKITRTNGEVFYATADAPTTIQQDPCHEDNQPAGATPAAGSLCEQMYNNNGGAYAGGSTTGTGATTWVACTGVVPVTCGALTQESITAIRFELPSFTGAAGGNVVKLELDPTGNIGGTPQLDARGNVTTTTTGDIYTNNFGGRVSEISLVVISNDVSVTPVAGSIGDYVWLDANGDGVQDASEQPLPNVTMQLFDGAGNPIYIDPVTGGIVDASYPGAITYTVQTQADGSYLFENLPAGDYEVRVDTDTLPADVVQTYDANGALDNSSDVTLAPETDSAGQLIGVEDNDEQDFGYMPLGSIGDTVWLDIDGDGVIGPNESGIGGVVIELELPDGTVITTTTSPTGTYLFPDLPYGAYTVTVDTTTLPPNLTQTYDVDGLLNDSSSTTIDADNPHDLDQDFGYQPPVGSIGDTVWFDIDGDGVQDPGEDGIGGVVIELEMPDGTVITTTTSPSGTYLFPNLPYDTYTVTVDTDTLPPELVQTFDADGGLDNSSSTTIDADNVDDLDQDFGYMPLGSIGDTVWLDLDGDGVMDPSESGIGGVVIELEMPDGTVITTTTSPTGTYLFPDLPFGNYTVTVDTDSLPPELAQTFDNDGGLDNMSNTTIDFDNPDDLDQDFGYSPVGSIGDTVWLDLDGDGVQDPSESGIPGIIIELEMPDGSVITTTTGPDGTYLFPDLPYGSYTVTVDVDSLPADLAQTFDADGLLDNSSSTTIDADNPNDLDQDFGYEPVGSIGDTVWMDLDGDGVMDPSESGIPGIIIELEMPDGSVITTTTGPDGTYLFPDLPFGSYTVTVDVDSLPADVAQTFDANGGLDNMSNTTIDADNPNDLDQDFGYQPQGSIGDTIWLDLDGDGIMDPSESGIPGIIVELTMPDGSVITTTTGPDGTYLFPNLPYGDYTVTVDVDSLPADLAQTFDADGLLDNMSNTTLDADNPNDLDQDFGYEPVGSIGDTIWLDTDGDGVQDPGEDGLAGITVILTLPDGSTISTVTDSDGTYLFPDLPYGDYTVAVDTSTLPEGLAQTFDADGGLDGMSSTTIDADNPNDLDQDFGYEPADGMIGDTIWLDLDGDGVQDADESGIEGVEVILTLPDGTTITTVTDENGNYAFTDLPYGDYTVSINTDTLPADLTQTFDASGILDNMSEVSLTEDAPSNLDQDFGYQPPLGSIGDNIWFDADGDGVQDPEEDGLAGVTVILTLPDGTTISTVTDENGNYLFPDLPAGDYTVSVDVSTLPAPYAQSYDADGIGSPNSSSLTLGAGENNLDQDFGYTSETTAVALRGVGANGTDGSTTMRVVGVIALALIAAAVALVVKRTVNSNNDA